jgi:hypothetical protein
VLAKALMELPGVGVDSSVSADVVTADISKTKRTAKDILIDRRTIDFSPFVDF